MGMWGEGVLDGDQPLDVIAGVAHDLWERAIGARHGRRDTDEEALGYVYLVAKVCEDLPSALPSEEEIGRVEDMFLSLHDAGNGWSNEKARRLEIQRVFRELRVARRRYDQELNKPRTPRPQ